MKKSTAHYTITTSLKEDVYLRLQSLREIKGFTLQQIVAAGIESLSKE